MAIVADLTHLAETAHIRTKTMAELNQLTNDFQDPSKLLSTLGTFWNGLYGGTEFVKTFIKARNRLELQTHRNVQELVACQSRFNVPVYHLDDWYAMRIKRSELEENNTYGLDEDYSGPIVYGGRSVFTYTIGESTITIKSKLKRVLNISDTIVNPSTLLTNGIDFTYQDLTFTFFDNPFDTFSVKPIYDEDGEVEDEEIVIWMYQAEFDYKYIYNHYGYVIGFDVPSSENYKAIVNAVFDAALGGSSRLQIINVLSAITDIPVIKTDGEIVEVVGSDSNGKFVVTDKYAYRLASNATVIVEAGDTLHAGDFISTGLKVEDFKNGIPEGLTSLVLGVDFLIGDFFLGTLEWLDTTESITVTENVSGKTKITWPLVGGTDDVIEWWNAIHANGVASGVSLANLMDTRENPVGEPTALNLPTTINPLEWLVENILKYNTFLVRITADELGPNAVGLDQMEVLRYIVPPHQRMINIIDTVDLQNSYFGDGYFGNYFGPKFFG